MAGTYGTSFEAVFREHLTAIYGYVAFRLAPRTDDAQDITQDVFVAGLKAWGEVRGETTPLQWLRAIARRKVANYFQHRRVNASLEAITPSREAGADGGALERAEMLSAVMRSIPPDCAELLEEKYLDGLSVREMARRRGKTEKAIESALTRARAMVREKTLPLHTRTGDLS
ncbi:MAG TPA: sigma-70 family RNA polymerase sigma factor [Phycisphaerae bacterium]|nr:sigma-70 family RNA polymerase sigma factor [Phycisphaerae bacterium]